MIQKHKKYRTKNNIQVTILAFYLSAKYEVKVWCYEASGACHVMSLNDLIMSGTAAKH